VPPAQVVLPKLISAVVVPIRIHCVVGFVIEVPPVTVILPVIPDNVMPWAAALPDDVMLVNVAASAPLCRPSAPPVPLSVTSLAVSVPKFTPEPILNPVVLPMVKPRSVLLLPARMLTPVVAAATVVITGAAWPVVGKGSLPAGTLTPAITSRDWLAPSPISF